MTESIYPIVEVEFLGGDPVDTEVTVLRKGNYYNPDSQDQHTFSLTNSGSNTKHDLFFLVKEKILDDFMDSFNYPATDYVGKYKSFNQYTLSASDVEGFTKEVIGNREDKYDNTKDEYAWKVIYRKIGITATLPDGVVGEEYKSEAPIVTNGAPDYTFEAKDLPAGLQIDATTGVISGTPTEAVTDFPITISVTDANGNKAEVEVIISITKATVIPDPKPKPKPQPKPEPKPEPLAPSGPLDILFGYGTTESRPIEIERILVRSYLKGFEDGTLKPENTLTRGEAATILARLISGEMDISPKSTPYKDVNNQWYSGYIDYLITNSYLKVETENFRPEDNITRGELAKLISLYDKKNDTISHFEDIKNHELESYINQAFGNGRIDGYPDGTFKADDYLKRSEAAKIFNNLFNRITTEEDIEKAANLYDLKTYPDLEKSHWAYFELVDATNTRYINAANNDWIEIVNR